MASDLSILKAASAMARHASDRHRLIAENVANADTPGYRARDLEDFSTEVNRSFTPRATRPGHLSQAGATSGAREIVSDLPVSPNGNSVTLEDQMLRAVEAQGEHRLAMTLYGKTIDLVRLGLGRGR